ncbi:MAG: substrate-binding domain-containing protein, partial [Acidobacteriota bacterium]
ELIPLFEARAGRRVKTIAVGSGKALALAERGEADLVLVHSPEDEERFMARGAGLLRRRLMYNDFVLVGPASDPAPVRGAGDAAAAMRAIARAGAPFVSRGDDSGTHRMERKLWRAASVEPPSGHRYVETGQGMAATLRVASERRSYTLADRGTFLAQRSTVDLEILFEGDPALRNVYHLIVVSPRQGPRVNVEGARDLARFLLSGPTLRRIRDFGRDRYGSALFVPEAEPAGEP